VVGVSELGETSSLIYPMSCYWIGEQNYTFYNAFATQARRGYRRGRSRGLWVIRFVYFFVYNDICFFGIL